MPGRLTNPTLEGLGFLLPWAWGSGSRVWFWSRVQALGLGCRVYAVRKRRVRSRDAIVLTSVRVLVTLLLMYPNELARLVPLYIDHAKLPLECRPSKGVLYQ